MKLLRIHDGKGHFLAASGDDAPIDQLTKDDLLRLVEQILTGEFEMDDFDSVALQNQAHRIIYENVFSKLSELKSRRREFLDESKRLYLSEYERYRLDASEVPQVDSDASQPPTGA
ncbi:hypothetical protein [Gemmatimonas aurantiaca]|uniref:hypothetical protein n=1 Tax=Gemmatimonas aurantiaca TaxID=173480 RepID=UPI00301D5622